MYTPQGFAPAHALPDVVSPEAYAFAFRGERILVHAGADESFVIPTAHGLAAAGVGGTPHFLGFLGTTPCVAFDLPDDAAEPAAMSFVGLRTLFFKVPEPLLALAARAFQIVDFNRTHRFCGRCGTATQSRPSERAKECPACGLVVYPRVAPAMMALVTRE